LAARLVSRETAGDWTTDRTAAPRSRRSGEVANCHGRKMARVEAAPVDPVKTTQSLKTPPESAAARLLA